MAALLLPKYIRVQHLGSNALVHINTRHPSFLFLFFKEAMQQSRDVHLAITMGRFSIPLPAWPIALPLVLKHIWRLARRSKD